MWALGFIFWWYELTDLMGLPSFSFSGTKPPPAPFASTVSEVLEKIFSMWRDVVGDIGIVESEEEEFGLDSTS